MPFTISEKNSVRANQGRGACINICGRWKAGKTRLYSSMPAPQYPPVLKWAAELHLSILVKSTYKNTSRKLHSFSRDISKIWSQKKKKLALICSIRLQWVTLCPVAHTGSSFFLLGLQTLDCVLS